MLYFINQGWTESSILSSIIFGAASSEVIVGTSVGGKWKINENYVESNNESKNEVISDMSSENVLEKNSLAVANINSDDVISLVQYFFSSISIFLKFVIF